MTFQEILENLKASGATVSDFAFNEFLLTDDFILPEPLETQRKKYNEYWSQSRDYRNSHPVPEYNQKAAEQEYLKAHNIPEWEEIDQYGGEGQGDTWWSIKYFPKHNVYIKVSGWYQSYNGTDFGDWNEACTQVFPQEKIITVYEPVSN